MLTSSPTVSRSFGPLPRSNSKNNGSTSARPTSSALTTTTFRSREAPMDFEYTYSARSTDIFSAPYTAVSTQKRAGDGVADGDGHTDTLTGSDENKAGSLKRTYSAATSVNVDRTPPQAHVFGMPFLFSPPVSSRTVPTGAHSSNQISEGISHLHVGGESDKSSPTSSVARRPLKRVRRRRIRHGSESDDHDGPSGGSDDEQSGHGIFSMGGGHKSQTENAVDHASLPYIISGYLQLAFNIFVVAIIAYFVTAFIQTVQRDIDVKVEEYSAEIMQEMSQCSKNYLENRCTPGDRVPAMEKACRAWESCMNRDPSEVGRAKVSAETFAEIINGFVEPISYKTMAFCVFLTFGSILVSNLAFGYYRSWVADGGHAAGSRGGRKNTAPPATQIHLHGGSPSMYHDDYHRRSSRSRRIAAS